MAAHGAEPLIFFAAGYSPEVKLLDGFRGSEALRTLTLHDYGHVNKLAVSSDSRLLAIAGNPHVQCFDVEVTGPATTHPIASYSGHKNNVGSVGFDANGRWLYTGSEDGTVRIWDWRDDKCQMTFPKDDSDKQAVHAAHLHPAQTELVIGDNQGKVSVWDITADAVRRTTVPDEGVPIHSVRLSPRGDQLVAANYKGMLYVWQHLDGSQVSHVQAHKAYVLSCTYSPSVDKLQLVTASSDTTCVLWEYEEEERGFSKSFAFEGHTKWVWDCAFARSGRLLVTGSSDCTCKIWDAKRGTQQAEVTGFRRGITTVAVVDRSSDELSPG